MIVGTNKFYTIRKIYEDEQLKLEDFQGNTNPEAEQDEEHVDIQELLQNVERPVNFNSERNLKNTSMHHFKLKTREVVEVFRFEGVEAVNSIQNALMNFIMERAGANEAKKSGVHNQIVAPKLFMNSTFKQCNLITNGVIQ